MAAEVTAPKQRGVPFQPGQSGNPAGRPKGARSKLGEKFLEDLLASWETSGVAAIAKVIEEKPDQYLKVVASILPKEIAAEVTHRFVARMPAPAESVEEWQKQHSPNPMIQ